MNIIINGKDFQLTESIKAYITEKAERLVRINEPIVQMRFDLNVVRGHHKGDIFEVNGIVEVAGNDIKAETKEEDMYAAIDVVMDKLDIQLRKRKERRLDELKRGA